jgi:radical SAM protein with 4Fe4S-binding SPASM domain
MATRYKAFSHYHHHVVSLMHHWHMHNYEMHLRPFNKFLNILRGVYEWKTHRIVLKSRPFLVRLNTSAICNFRCPPCLKKESFKLKPGQSREPFIMSMETYDNILNVAGPYAQRMTFHITGEPLMNSRLFDMVKKAHERKIFTYFSTNYNLMTPELITAMFDSGLSKIKIAFDGFTQKTYDTYRVGGDVEKLKRLIALTMEEKRRRKARHPMVEVQIITFHHVMPEIDEIKQFCREQGVDQIMSIPDGCNFDGHHTKEVNGTPYKHCFWPWLQAAVDSDGNVFPCGQDFDGLLPLGNVNNESFDSIWNGELYRETRLFLSGKAPKRDDLDLHCYKCPSGFGKSGKWVLPMGTPLLLRNKKEADTFSQPPVNREN